MDQIVFLDTGVLGYIVNPNAKPKEHEVSKCLSWLRSQLEMGKKVCIPEIVDYELRRSLLLNDLIKSLAILDELKSTLEYVAINTKSMMKAAELWSNARKIGLPTAHDKALDGDVILCAQAMTYNEGIVIATTNVAHLSRFVNAKLWNDIK